MHPKLRACNIYQDIILDVDIEGPVYKQLWSMNDMVDKMVEDIKLHEMCVGKSSPDNQKKS